MSLKLSRQRLRQHVLGQFKYIRTCVLARELCLLIRTGRVTFNREDVRQCCNFISNLCKEAGCKDPSDLCAKAAVAVMESEETYLKLCEESCKKCSESKQPRAKPKRTVYVS